MHEPQLMHEHTCACAHAHMHMHGLLPLWALSLRLWSHVREEGRVLVFTEPRSSMETPSGNGPVAQKCRAWAGGRARTRACRSHRPQAARFCRCPREPLAVVLDMETPTTPLREPGLNQPLAPVSAPHAPSEVKLSRAQAGRRPPPTRWSSQDPPLGAPVATAGQRQTGAGLLGLATP